MICQNCKTDFTIEPDDVGFYEKMHVPSPTFCPACRFQRRVSWRNPWHLFKKKEARTGEEIFSLYPAESPVKIYDREYWISDAWDAMEYGRAYDFSRTFFEQFRDLVYAVPFPAHTLINVSNCRYCTNANGIKNCYLVRAATFTEDSAYLIWDHASKQCMDSHMTNKCELGYGNVNCQKCYKTIASVDCDDCNEVFLSKDCVGCSSCFGCMGLRGKSYCIFNEQYSKEEYKKRLEEMQLGSYDGFQKAQHKAYEFWKTKPHKFMHGLQNVNVSGDYIYESKNARECFRVLQAEDCKYCQNILTGTAKDCYDYSNWGERAELIYESIVCGEGVSNVRFSTQIFTNAKNIEYSIYCQNSSDLFGCVGLRNKQYCIFNMQYTKDAFHELRKQIIEQMDAMPFISRAGHEYRYGEFFPPEFSPFSYEVSEASEFFPLDEADVVAKGFQQYDIATQQHTPTLAATDLPDGIDAATDAILDEVIGCEHAEQCKQECTGAFRIVKDELAFLKRLGLPLPRLCPNCRHYERLTLRNPPMFYDRQCANCGKKIQTSYAPDRPEKIYCEQCYQAEVV